MTIATAIAVAGLAIAAAGAIGTTVTGVLAAKQQKKSAKAQEAQARLQAQQERRRMIRNQRIARATSLNFASQVGGAAEGTSGIAGGLSSLSSQLGSGLGFANQQQGLSDTASRANQKANSLNAIGGVFQGVGKLGSTLFDAAGGFDTLRGAFGPKSGLTAGVPG